MQQWREVISKIRCGNGRCWLNRRPYSNNRHIRAWNSAHLSIPWLLNPNLSTHFSLVLLLTCCLPIFYPPSFSIQFSCFIFMVFIGSIHLFTVINELSVKLGIFIHISTHRHQGIEAPIHSIIPHLKASRAYRFIIYT